MKTLERKSKKKKKEPVPCVGGKLSSPLCAFYCNCFFLLLFPSYSLVVRTALSIHTYIQSAHTLSARVRPRLPTTTIRISAFIRFKYIYINLRVYLVNIYIYIHTIGTYTIVIGVCTRALVPGMVLSSNTRHNYDRIINHY